jgi:MFS family permease
MMDTQLDLSSSTIGTISSIGQVMAMMMMLQLPRLIDRWGHGGILLGSTLGLGISLIPLAAYPHWSTAAITWIGVRVLAGMWITALQVFQMELVDEQWRSLAYGAVAMAMGLGFGSTSYSGGYVVAARGYAAILWLGAAASGVASLAITLILRRRSGGENPESLENHQASPQTPPQAVSPSRVEAGPD